MLRLLLIAIVGLYMGQLPADVSSSAESGDKNTKQLIIILLGPPGSGKGTQAVELSKMLGIPHISTGDLFRENIRNNTELGLKAKSYIDKGALVPDALVLDILFDRIKQPDAKRGCLLDGFPRTLAQANELEDSLRDQVRFVVFNLRVSEEEIIHRIAGRFICHKCGKVYQQDKNPPKAAGVCDTCGGELYQRSDDTEPVVRERLRVYHQQTKPLEEFYRKKSVLIEIDASQSQQEVLKAIAAKLQELGLYPT
jgi:adenylate kinase